MVRRTVVALTAMVLFAFAPSAPAAAAPEPVVPQPAPVDGDTTLNLIPVPLGCPVPEPADVAFVGTVLAKDEFVEKGTVRYRIDQVRAGSAGPFAIDGRIDVRYGPDSQYLKVDSQYLVSASVDRSIAALASKIAPEAPLFGGDAVVGLEDTETECPVIDDPVMTINLDGTAVESGLLTPLLADRPLLLATIGVPALAVAGVLVGLVLLRKLLGGGLRAVFALGRAAVTPSADPRASRVRRHFDEQEAERRLRADGTLTGGQRTADNNLSDSST